MLTVFDVFLMMIRCRSGAGVLALEWYGGRVLVMVSGTALDVGAGRGIASYALAREGFSVTALEPDPSPVVGAAALRALAKETSLGINVVEEFSERFAAFRCQFRCRFCARRVASHAKPEQAFAWNYTAS